MKKLILISLIFFLFPKTGLAAESTSNLGERLSGRILLQVESYGRAWYVYPVNKQRYYLGNGDFAYQVMRDLGLGITNADLAKIPTKSGMKADSALVNRLKGRILLQVEDLGRAWYVNPVDGLRYYLKDGADAYSLMKNFALGITNDNLRQITMNQSQLVADTTFNDVAYVKYNGQSFSNGYNADMILSPASMTKLMTALVLLDTGRLDWLDQAVITAEQISYPASLAGDDKTSEINCAVGDKIAVSDLWLAMLLASSNQATVALVDQVKIPRSEFVKLMNEKALSLGLKKTVFYDITGLDPHNVTTAKEMAIIAKTAFEQTRISDASITREYTINALDNAGNPKAIKVINRNYSLLQFDPQGVKTGYLVEAQRTVSLKKDGQIIVIMHALSMAQRNNIIKNLLNYAQ